MKIRLIWFMAALALTVSTASADQYWIAYEGDDYPENEGWTRNWGDWTGQYHGGAIRSLNSGVLTYDSLHDDGVFDFSYIEMPGQIDPGPGELFVMEWRLKVDEVNGIYDPGVALFSDMSRGLGFGFTECELIGGFEHGLTIPIAPGLFHEYRVQSWNMLTYELYIDNVLAKQGLFTDTVTASYVGWGDNVQGAASIHHWDYFHFGVVPEASSILLIILTWACCGRWRRLRTE